MTYQTINPATATVVRRTTTFPMRRFNELRDVAQACLRERGSEVVAGNVAGSFMRPQPAATSKSDHIAGPW